MFALFAFLRARDKKHWEAIFLLLTQAQELEVEIIKKSALCWDVLKVWRIWCHFSFFNTPHYIQFQVSYPHIPLSLPNVKRKIIPTVEKKKIHIKRETYRWGLGLHYLSLLTKKVNWKKNNWKRRRFFSLERISRDKSHESFWYKMLKKINSLV